MNHLFFLKLLILCTIIFWVFLTFARFNLQLKFLGRRFVYTANFTYGVSWLVFWWFPTRFSSLQLLAQYHISPPLPALKTLAHRSTHECCTGFRRLALRIFSSCVVILSSVAADGRWNFKAKKLYQIQLEDFRPRFFTFQQKLKSIKAYFKCGLVQGSAR